MYYKIKIVLFSIFVVFIFALIYVLNNLFPLYSDDYLYSFIYSTKPLVPVQNLRDVIISQVNHYFEWGGRSVAHFIAQSLLLMKIEWSKLLNSLTYVLFVLIIYKLSNNQSKINVSLLLFISTLLWLFLPSKIETLFWITGSANYLWGTFIVLLFLYPYCRYFNKGNKSNNVFKTILFFLGGMIAGWTNENLFIGLFFFIIGIFFLYKKQNKNIPTWAIAGFIGVFIGGCIMLLAPGNFIRSENIEISLGFDKMSFFQNVSYRFGKVLYRYLIYILPLSILYFLSYLIYTKKTNRGLIRKEVIGFSLLFLISAHVSCAVMLASPIFPPRAIFGIITFMVIAIGILYSDMIFKTRMYQRLNSLMIIILVMISSVLYMIDYKKIHTISDIIYNRENYLLSEREKGNNNIIFDKRMKLPKTIGLDDLSDDPRNGFNRVYAIFYNVDSVRLCK